MKMLSVYCGGVAWTSCCLPSEHRAAVTPACNCHRQGGAGEGNVVMSLLLHDYWRIDLCLWATCVFPTLQRRHKYSMAKVFVFFIQQHRCSVKNNIQLFISTKGVFRRSLTYDDHSLQSRTYSAKLLLKN